MTDHERILRLQIQAGEFDLRASPADCDSHREYLAIERANEKLRELARTAGLLLKEIDRLRDRNYELRDDLELQSLLLEKLQAGGGS